jgi:hypothetical protein
MQYFIRINEAPRKKLGVSKQNYAEANPPPPLRRDIAPLRRDVGLL